MSPKQEGSSNSTLRRERERWPCFCFSSLELINTIAFIFISMVLYSLQNFIRTWIIGRTFPDWVWRCKRLIDAVSLLFHTFLPNTETRDWSLILHVWSVYSNPFLCLLFPKTWRRLLQRDRLGHAGSKRFCLWASGDLYHAEHEQVIKKTEINWAVGKKIITSYVQRI